MTADERSLYRFNSVMMILCAACVVMMAVLSCMHPITSAWAWWDVLMTAWNIHSVMRCIQKRWRIVDQAHVRHAAELERWFTSVSTTGDDHLRDDGRIT